MKNKITLLIVSLLITRSSLAQQEPMTREEKDEKNAARTARVNAKNDYANFRKQILGLKQYDAERQKIPALRKATKMTVKVLAVVDSSDNDEEEVSKTLTGSIRLDVGDNSTIMYELTFDRAQKKIVSIKHTQEAIDADKEMQDDQQEKATEPKKAVLKKTKDDEDDDPDDKPAKGKKKDKDDDD